MAHYYRLKNMDDPRYNGRMIQTVDVQDRECLEPITESEYLASYNIGRASVCYLKEEAEAN